MTFGKRLPLEQANRSEVTQLVYRAIKIFVNRNGYSPTYPEIIDILGVLDNRRRWNCFHVNKGLNALEAFGYIERQRYKTRGIRLIED